MNVHREEWRQKRNNLNKANIPFDLNYSVKNYSTASHNKYNMKPFEDGLIKDHMIAENFNITEKMAPFKSDFSSTEKIETKEQRSPYLAGITNVISGVFNLITGAMFQRRTEPPPFEYYDKIDGAPEYWHQSNFGEQNKNGLDPELTDVEKSNMSVDYRDVISHCEEKLDKVRLLLSNNAPTAPKYVKRTRRPKRMFVEPSSVEEQFEDAFSPEDFVQLANETFVECVSPFYYQIQELFETDSPMMKVESCTKMNNTSGNEKYVNPLNTSTLKESNDNLIANTIESLGFKKTELSGEENKNREIGKSKETDQTKELNIPTNKEVVLSCEDKLSQLKAVLQKNKQSKLSSARMQPENVKIVRKSKFHDKRFKNADRTTSKRASTKLKLDIQNDMLYAHEIESDELNSCNSSPNLRVPVIPTNLSNKQTAEEQIKQMPTKTEPIPINQDVFDEVSGRFYSTSADSNDSFQIVFSDSPQTSRKPRLSDCDSEDSFIVFEDSPDSCYTSVDVFGDESDTESDSDSDVSDSGCEQKCLLSGSMSRTVADLTDDTLFSESVDEVDCAFETAVEIPDEHLAEVRPKGLLTDQSRRLLRATQPPKKVHFSSQPPKVHVMRVWAFAARQARAGHWERHALDRERFKRRIADVDMAVSWVLKPQHRSRVMFQRFMPWWNVQKRKELAEKKQKEEDRLRRQALDNGNDNADRDNDATDNCVNNCSDNVSFDNTAVGAGDEAIGNCVDDETSVKNDEFVNVTS